MVRVNIPFYCHGTGKKEIFRHYFSLTVGDEPVTLPNGTIVDNAIMKECLFCETLLLNFEEAKTERYDNRIPANEPLPIPIKVMDYGGRVLHLVDYEEWSKQEENGACTINFCMLDDTRQYTDRWRKNKGPYKGYFYGWPINLTRHRHDQGSGHRKLTPFFKTLKKYHEYTLHFVREPVCDVSCLDDMKKPFMYWGSLVTLIYPNRSVTVILHHVFEAAIGFMAFHLLQGSRHDPGEIRHGALVLAIHLTLQLLEFRCQCLCRLNAFDKRGDSLVGQGVGLALGRE